MRPGDYVWDLLPNSDGFVLRVPGTEYSCINQYGGPGGPLKYWNDKNSPRDNGSTFRIFEANVDAIPSIHNSQLTIHDDIYDLSGRQIINRKLSTHTLPRGIYIVNGRKIVIR